MGPGMIPDLPQAIGATRDIIQSINENLFSDMDKSIENIDPLVLPGLEGIKEETEAEEALQRIVSEPEGSIITEVEILFIISKWDPVKNYLNNITTRNL